MLKLPDKDPLPLKLPDKDPTPVNELARALDKHVATVYRWGSPRGVRGHRLRLARIGGRTVVFRRDLESFLAALNSDSAPGPSNQTHEAQVREELIDAQLDAEGF
jgi:hypothetical protein